MPIKAEAIANTKPNRPKYICNGMMAALNDSLAPGTKYAAKPTTYCKQKSMTADRPNHECNEYMFGMGTSGKLCESNTVMRAITVNMNAPMCTAACVIFNAFLCVERKPRYTKMAEKIG